MSDTIKVLLVDDQALLRQALANLLAQQANLSIVGTASDGHEAIKQVALYRPDIVLLDIEMPNLDGLSATRLITQRFPESKVILLSAHDNKAYLMKALRAGAKAYLLKNTLSSELIDTIQNVHKGYGQFGPGILEKMVEGMLTPAEQGVEVVRSQSLNQAATAAEMPLQEAEVALAFSRFEPEELRSLVGTLRLHPQAAIAFKPKLEQQLSADPTNLAALYVQGALSQTPWNLPQVALRSLQAGFQSGIHQELSPEALLLFYREALPLNPITAFSWLTQAGSPWNLQKRLPFLIKEAAKLFGPASAQCRTLLLLYRIRGLKTLMTRASSTTPFFPNTAARKPATVVSSLR